MLCCWRPYPAEQQGRLEDDVSVESGQEDTIHPFQNGRRFLEYQWQRVDLLVGMFAIISVVAWHTCTLICSWQNGRLLSACNNMSTSLDAT